MGYVPAHVDVHAPGQVEPKEVAIILHGILGSGANWRSFVRGLVKRHPDWLFVLVDLRNHGESVGAEGPHTLAACADDIAALCADRGFEPSLVWGHSFGGKVALAYASAHRPELDEVWLLDTPLGAEGDDRSGGAELRRVLDALRSIPVPLANRAALLPALTARGITADVADWLGTNLRLESGGYRWRVDFDVIEEMVADYFAADFWPLVGAPALAAPPTYHVVRGLQSDRMGPEELASLEAVVARGAPVVVHQIPEAGHWLHVDAPGPLAALLEEALIRIGRRLH